MTATDVNPIKRKGEPVIQIRDLGFSYGEKPVFRHLNLNIYANEFVGLIGANGSGKSTLVKLILGLETPTEGKIIRFGKENWESRSRSQIGYISQKAASFNSAFPGTVEEVVMANLWSKIGLLRRPKAVHRQRVKEALELVGMQDYRRQLIGNLSGGQQQRVFLARVLVNEPKLIFLDEPTVGIDAKSEGEIYQLLNMLNQKAGVGIVLVSHDIGAVTVHTERLLCMGADGFFEHDTAEPLAADFLSRLYGYEVLAHSHLNPAWAGIGSTVHCDICDRHHHHNNCDCTAGAAVTAASDAADTSAGAAVTAASDAAAAKVNKKEST